MVGTLSNETAAVYGDDVQCLGTALSPNDQVLPSDHPEPWLRVPREVAAVLRVGVPRASERVIQAIQEETPAYHRPLAGEFGRMLRGGVDGALERFVELIENAEPDALGASRSLYYDLGRGEFLEGRSLDALLGAYNVGGRVAWQEIVSACAAAEVEPRTLYLLAEAVFAYINELSAVSAAGYSAEQAAAAGATQAAYQELVELLTARQKPDPAVLGVAADRAGWPIPDRLSAVACTTGEPGQLAIRAGKHAIGARIGSRVCLLVPEENGHGVSASESLTGLDAGVGPVVALEEASLSWRWACRTLRLIDSGTIAQRGVVRAEDHLAALFLHGDERLADALAERWLAPLQRLSERSRHELPETLLSWLAHQCNFGLAAADLHLHPHTVRYRVDKLRQLYGTALDDPDARFEIELALRSSGLRVRPCSATTASIADSSGCA